MQYRSLIQAGALLLLWGVLAGALGGAILGPQGGLYLSLHEGDTIHLADIVMRQVAGQWPHLDFMTPIGVLATAPIAWLVAAGWGLGPAILLAQAGFGLMLLPGLWWLARTRFTGPWGLAYAGVSLVLAMALIHGETLARLSISMHYNRWAWALAGLVLALAILPPRLPRVAVGDGLLLGLALAALGLIKVTYLAALLPVALAALWLRRDGVTFVVGLCTGLAVVAAVSVVAGLGFWSAYIGDLLAVRASPIRSAPGASFLGVVTDPAYIACTIVALAAVILLRKAGRAEEGALLLLALPGFFFVTYQNFGNDPQWLYFLGIFLLAMAADLPAPHRTRTTLAGAVTLALAAPSFANLATSPFRHLNVAHGSFAPLFPEAPWSDGLSFRAARIETVRSRDALSGFDSDTPEEIGGVPISSCQLDTGMVAVYRAMAARLDEEAPGGAMITADLFNALWLYRPDLVPPSHGSPWYYGDATGLDQVERLLVPRCPILPKAQRVMLEAVTARGFTLREISQDPLYRLYELQAPR